MLDCWKKVATVGDVWDKSVRRPLLHPLPQAATCLDTSKRALRPS